MTAPLPDLDNVSPPAELVALIASEARGLLHDLELPISDLQLWPLGPEAAVEVARIRGLLLNLQAAADALSGLDLGLPPGLEPITGDIDWPDLDTSLLDDLLDLDLWLPPELELELEP